jgi:hypothetical protein
MHQQNGVPERLNLTIIGTSRALLFDSGLGIEYWAEACAYAIYLKNRTPHKALNGITPYEALFGTKPDLSSIRRFGCRCFVLIPKEKRTKMEARAFKGIFVGLQEHASNQYRIFNIAKGQVQIHRDVLFDEFPPPSTIPTTTIYPYQIIPEPQELQQEGDYDEIDLELNASAPSNIQDETAPSNYQQSPEIEDSITLAPQQHQEPPKSRPQRIRKPREFYGSQTTSNMIVDFAMHATSIAQFPDDPQTLQQALDSQDSKQWQAAIKEEIDALERNKTWTIAPIPAGRTPITSTIKFKRKLDSIGNTSRFKARLVARGFQQKEGIDYDEIYSPVVKMDSIRILLAIAASEGLVLHQMDVKTAFLNSVLTQPFYMFPPPRLGINIPKGHALRIEKGLYGSKSSNRDWNIEITTTLKKNGFIQIFADFCLFIKQDAQKSETVIIALYVDDLLLAGSSEQALIPVKAFLNRKYEMVDLGKANWLLGIEIIQHPSGTIQLSQRQYIERILQRFGLQDSNPVATPLEPAHQLRNAAPDEPRADKTTYQQLIGSLMYAMIATRPDLAYSVSLLSQFASDPSETHLKAAK